jgi:hypothetical protein
MDKPRRFQCVGTSCSKEYSAPQNLSKHYSKFPSHRAFIIPAKPNALFSIEQLSNSTNISIADQRKFIGCPFWANGGMFIFPVKCGLKKFLNISPQSRILDKTTPSGSYITRIFSNHKNRMVKIAVNKKVSTHKVCVDTMENIVNHGRVIEAMYLRTKSFTSRIRAASVMHVGISAMAGDLAVCKTVSDKSDQLSGTTSIMTRTSFPANQVPSANNISQIHGSIAAQQALDNPDQLEEKNSLASSVEFINGSYTITSKWLSRIVLEMDAAAEPQEESHNSGLVYFIRLGETSLVKVGMTGNIEQRIRTLQCGSPFQLNIEYTIQTGQPRLMESMMHKTLTKMGLHVRGEWFSLIAGFGHIDLYLQTKMLMKYKN